MESRGDDREDSISFMKTMFIGELLDGLSENGRRPGLFEIGKRHSNIQKSKKVCKQTK